MSSVVLKRYIPTVLISAFSLVILLEYFTGNPTLQSLVDTVSGWAAIIIAFSLTVAFISMSISRGRNVLSRQPGEWYYSAIFLVALFLQLFLGLAYGTKHALYSNIWTNINLSAYSAMSASTALYIISSAYRVFRARSKEATVLVIAAILVMLGQASIFAAIWPGFPTIRDWIWDNPAAATMRGITIVTAIGLVALTIRIMLGITRVIGEAPTEEGEM